MDYDMERMLREIRFMTIKLYRQKRKCKESHRRLAYIKYSKVLLIDNIRSNLNLLKRKIELS